MSKERKPVPRDPGKGFNPEELCRLKGTKVQGNTIHNGSFPGNCSVTALFGVCLGYEQAASSEGFSQGPSQPFFSPDCQPMGRRSGKDDREQKPRKFNNVLSHRKVKETDPRASSTGFSYWEICV